MACNPPFTWTNPRQVDLNRPYLYFIVIRSPATEYRYVGKGSTPSRMDAYARNVLRVLAGQTKRPATTQDGRAQSKGNIKYRYVHLILAAAVRRGWLIEHYPLENCKKGEHTTRERARKVELLCNMNDRVSWFVEDFDHLAKDLE